MAKRPSRQTAHVPIESQTLECADGYPLSASLFKPDPADGAAGKTIVIAPALGVPARFYAAYAEYLAGRGFTVLSFDYRGSGRSVNGPVRGRDIAMSDWGQLDIEAALAHAREGLRAKRLFLVGHSAGAQLPGLAPSSKYLDGMIAVAGSAPHLRHYPLKTWPLFALTWYLLGPLLSWRRDDFPARQTGLGSTPVATGVVAQWCRWARSRDYLFDAKHGLDTHRYAKLRLPVLSYGFADDGYATEPAINALLVHYPIADIEQRIVPRSGNGTIGHFGFFRDRQKESLWRQSAEWLEARA